MVVPVVVLAPGPVKVVELVVVPEFGLALVAVQVVVLALESAQVAAFEVELAFLVLARALVLGPVLLLRIERPRQRVTLAAYRA